MFLINDGNFNVSVMSAESFRSVRKLEIKQTGICFAKDRERTPISLPP